MAEKKYVVIGGYLNEVGRGLVYLNPERLAKLHGLPVDACVLADGYNDQKLRGRDLSQYVVITPQTETG